MAAAVVLIEPYPLCALDDGLLTLVQWQHSPARIHNSDMSNGKNGLLPYRPGTDRLLDTNMYMYKVYMFSVKLTTALSYITCSYA